jgi:signal transduction histidine kinase
MRLGVSTKIFLAYAILLSVFAVSSVFTLVYLRRGRQELAANQPRLEVRGSVDAALRSLEYFDRTREGSGRSLNLISRVVAQNGIASARQNLKDGLDAIARYLENAPNPVRRGEFDAYRRELTGLDNQVAQVAAFLGSNERAAGDTLEVDRSLANLLSNFHRLKADLRSQDKAVAKELEDNERRAVEIAFVLTGLGLVLAVGAALMVYRTLRPLRVLREHTQQIAGGDYARRTGITSRDEIGELAREFDAMATAIEEREHRLIRSERLATVGRMAAHVTHEIRNPLASVGLNLELLADEIGPQNPEAKRLVESIGNEVDRLSEITETYLRFVRLPKPKLEREDLGALVTSVLEFARNELTQAGISVHRLIDADLPEVEVDESQIRQALLNLIRNAKEAMNEGGALEVTVKKGANEHVELCISDSGSGISPGDLAKIFDPFFSTKTKGTGLGLALVQQIVGDHGGRIEVNCPLTGGTRFSICLPSIQTYSETSKMKTSVMEG